MGSSESAAPEKIEACPWCGGTSTFMEVFPSDYMTARVGCGCGAQGPIGKDKPASIEAWNSLAHRLAASERRVEALRFEAREIPKRMIESACVAIRSACFVCGGSGYAQLPERVRTGEVSRDMAIDACAPEMEGQPIYQDFDGEECQYCGVPCANLRASKSSIAAQAAAEGERRG